MWCVCSVTLSSRSASLPCGKSCVLLLSLVLPAWLSSPPAPPAPALAPELAPPLPPPPPTPGVAPELPGARSPLTLRSISSSRSVTVAYFIGIMSGSRFGCGVAGPPEAELLAPVALAFTSVMFVSGSGSSISLVRSSDSSSSARAFFWKAAGDR
uniref:Putative secreted protein n=1 Tax=Anopheles darlingi TaxID=43151 RepID=A0A2M4DAE0_ANODA